MPNENERILDRMRGVPSRPADPADRFDPHHPSVPQANDNAGALKCGRCQDDPRNWPCIVCDRGN